MSWDTRFITLAAHVSSWSKDPSTAVGAVVVGSFPNLVSVGFNGLPPGISDDDRLLDPGWRRDNVVHAEVNALINAMFDPQTLYSTHFPCHRCAVQIISYRTMKRVVTHKPTGLFAVSWADSLTKAESLFTEAGLEVCFI